MKKIKLFILSVLFILFNAQLYSQTSDPYPLYGIWAKRAAFGSNGSAKITSSIMDDSGNVFLSGIFSGTLNFSDNICNPVNSAAGSSGEKGEFLIKFNNQGEYQWHITYTITQGTLDPSTNADHTSEVLDYQNGKILFYGKFVYQQIEGTLGIKASLYKDGLVSSTPIKNRITIQKRGALLFSSS